MLDDDIAMLRPVGLELVCCERWEAPRYDAPMSIDVTHVCAQAVGHDGPCVCACRAQR